MWNDSYDKVRRTWKKNKGERMDVERTSTQRT
jgi:hypothetical protein